MDAHNEKEDRNGRRSVWCDKILYYQSFDFVELSPQCGFAVPIQEVKLDFTALGRVSFSIWNEKQLKF